MKKPCRKEENFISEETRPKYKKNLNLQKKKQFNNKNKEKEENAK